MLKLSRLMVLSGLFLLLMTTPLLAQAAGGGPSYSFAGAAVGAGVGAGVTIVGAGIGFGRIGAAALESMARQPEVAGRVQTAMIVIAALLEGVTLFALVVCIVVGGKATF
jgi:F-type H+-transporting ATPase subunit c